MTTTTTQDADRTLEALAVLGAGAVGATTLLLFATGRFREGYTVAFASAWLGAIYGALRIYSSR